MNIFNDTGVMKVGLFMTPVSVFSHKKTVKNDGLIYKSKTTSN
ncbi:hypothetical protein PALB_36890 [Pseudoalteromonas luteoviolacea B = ATCC 29581]|nr:hypothetical protein PALB_36890 [Pseudoalteromonas luteoviolacea B = ATCC 29581]